MMSSIWLVGDGGFGAALQGVAEVGVEVAIVGCGRRNAAMIRRTIGVDLREHAPVFFGLGAPRTFFRNVAEAEANFLGIEGSLGEGSLCRRAQRSECRGAAARMLEPSAARTFPG